jgi:NitT/TauT family transport system permease protein
MSDLNNGVETSKSGILKIALPEKDEVRTVSVIQKFWTRTQGFFYPFFTLVMLVSATEAIVRVFGIRDFVLPAPTQVFQTLISSWSYLWTNTQPTLFVVSVGFTLSLCTAVPIGILIASSKVMEKFVYPLLVTAQTIPKIALAPMLVIWFGFSATPKLVITVLISFFPMVINTVAGLQAVPQEMLDLAKSSRASRWTTFRKIRWPFALPSVFAGLKIAITLAVIGAIVGEYVGGDKGLGFVLIVAAGRLEMDLVFAAVVILVGIGMTSFYTLAFIERLTIPWHESIRKDSRGR